MRIYLKHITEIKSHKTKVEIYIVRMFYFFIDEVKVVIINKQQLNDKPN